MTTTELVHRPSTTVPAGEWNLMSAQADALARSNIIPRAYQRQPANVLVAAITGRHYGWDVLTAMRNGHVIEGSWGMKPEAMLGLVRQAGHSVKGELQADGAKVTGTRADTGDAMTIGFTIAEAVRAGLCQMKDGKPWSRSSSGKPLPWEQYPQMMCWWRAVGLLCRVLFSDITAGVYTAEELGAAIDQEGEVIDVAELPPVEPMPLSDEALAKFREACEQIDVGPAVVLAHTFPNGVPEPLTDEHLPKMRDAYRHMVEEQALEQELKDEPKGYVRERGKLDRFVGEGEQPETEEVADGENVVVNEQRPATRRQVGKIQAEYARLEIEGRDARLRSTSELVGRVIGSHNELGHDEAEVVIATLVSADPATIEQLTMEVGDE